MRFCWGDVPGRDRYLGKGRADSPKKIINKYRAVRSGRIPGAESPKRLVNYGESPLIKMRPRRRRRRSAQIPRSSLCIPA